LNYLFLNNLQVTFGWSFSIVFINSFIMDYGVGIIETISEAIS